MDVLTVKRKPRQTLTYQGYAFIKVVKQKAPSDQGISYKVPSKAEDVPR